MNPYGLNSEYGRLTAVLLYPPGPEIGNHPEPLRIQQLHPIDHNDMMSEYSVIMVAFLRLGIEIEIIDPAPLGIDRDYLYNLMYCRDLFFMTPQGAIMASMANETRAGEVQYAARTLAELGIPILHTVGGAGRFEGADALWLDEKTVVVGVGNRTNSAGFEQIKQVLDQQGILCIDLPSTQTRTQHLLGSLQIVDKDLALVREEITDPNVVELLRGNGFTVVELCESNEIREKQAMNIVVVAPRTIFMTADCPETKRIYEKAGLTVAAELEISQLINGAGGLACATGILAREGEITAKGS